MWEHPYGSTACCSWMQGDKDWWGGASFQAKLPTFRDCAKAAVQHKMACNYKEDTSVCRCQSAADCWTVSSTPGWKCARYKLGMWHVPDVPACKPDSCCDKVFLLAPQALLQTATVRSLQHLGRMRWLEGKQCLATHHYKTVLANGRYAMLPVSVSLRSPQLPLQMVPSAVRHMGAQKSASQGRAIVRKVCPLLGLMPADAVWCR